MKNAIKYYYGLEPSNIHQKDNFFYFLINEYKFIFTECENIEEIDEIYNLSNELLSQGIYLHQIILNLFSKVITQINNKNYILLKIFIERNEININDIINFNNINYINNTKLKKNNWYLMWTNKIDYLEYQVNQIGKKYPLVTKSFSYYVGLSEIAISLIKNIQMDLMPVSLNHRRILCYNDSYDLYNPLNTIVDLRIRDVCEYFKSCFFSNKDVMNEINSYLFYNKLEYNEACCFFARLLFPTYYFDTYEKIINNEIDESNLNNIILKVDSYEIFLKRIYKILRTDSNIPSIEWLENINLN